jgi:Ca2+-binding EF-hand superfamily protein
MAEGFVELVKGLIRSNGEIEEVRGSIVERSPRLNLLLLFKNFDKQEKAYLSVKEFRDFLGFVGLNRIEETDVRMLMRYLSLGSG